MKELKNVWNAIKEISILFWMIIKAIYNLIYSILKNLAILVGWTSIQISRFIVFIAPVVWGAIMILGILLIGLIGAIASGKFDQKRYKSKNQDQ
jgi:membrane-anchored glycerophosphoryl diester phosphodiesterase (GDPDase)